MAATSQESMVQSRNFDAAILPAVRYP